MLPLNDADFLIAGIFETILSLHQEALRWNVSWGGYRKCKSELTAHFVGCVCGGGGGGMRLLRFHLMGDIFYCLPSPLFFFKIILFSRTCDKCLVIGYELTVIGYELTGFRLTLTSFDILVGGYERILNDLPSARIKRMTRDQKVLCGNYSRKFCKVIIVTLPTLSLLHLRHTAVNA